MFAGREERLREMVLVQRGAASGNLDLMKRVMMAADREAVAEHFYIDESALEEFHIKNDEVKKMVVEEVNMLVDIMLSIIDEI